MAQLLSSYLSPVRECGQNRQIILPCLANSRQARLYFIRIEPVLPKRISPLSCDAQPSAFSSSMKCASWLPGSFGDVLMTFHCQLPFFARYRKRQLLSAKLWLVQCDFSLVTVLRQFSRYPRVHLLS